MSANVLSDLKISLFRGVDKELAQLQYLAKEWQSTQSFWPAESIVRSLNQPDTLLWYAQNSNAAGWSGLVLMRLLGNDAELLYIHTAIQSRGLGIGAAMMRHVQKELSPKLQKIFLEVRPSNLAAQALYTSLGFRMSGRRKNYYKDGEDALIFEIAVT